MMNEPDEPSDQGEPDQSHDQSPQSRGGKARADKLSPAQRTAIARRAAVARWQGDLPFATHDGTLFFGEKSIACAVLNTRIRVLTQETFLTSIGRAAKAKGGTGVFGADGVDDLPPFLSADNLKPFIGERLRQSTTPILYRTKGGVVAMGFDARLLPMVCDVYLHAGLARKLTKAQIRIAHACRELQQGFSEIGIVTLVDDATGYSDDRARDELAKILEAYIAPHFARWTRRFPHEFRKQVYRLYNWNYNPKDTRTPRYMGKFIMKYVYGGLPPAVVDRLKTESPNNANGQRPRKLFQFLTDETGIPHLDLQITTVTTLMRASIDKDQFEALYGRAFAKEVQQRLPFASPGEPKMLPPASPDPTDPPSDG